MAGDRLKRPEAGSVAPANSLAKNLLENDTIFALQQARKLNFPHSNINYIQSSATPASYMSYTQASANP